ncbi:hypothetical protein [Tsukamurella sp. PLM1]|uniref:hypothetical protein n=1 Tax=Tsukamurella sp. PLM1 TaxID=2929795 RepID=UPI00204F62EE|nr:hypothetical protein [Tsukamurella sp. PLM1]BDH56009.1 hypothetical protein MTP03_09480 [Tsukamurella sp. PLM1]
MTVLRIPALRRFPCSALAFVAGLAFGGFLYTRRNPVVAGFVPWTAAWPQHAVVAVVGVALIVAIRVRRWPPRVPAVTPARLLAAVPLLGVLMFAAFRAGVQVLAGLDPNFTVNAWGGPTYLGAMACHYLDMAVGGIVVVGALRLLLTRPAARPDAGQRAASTAS